MPPGEEPLDLRHPHWDQVCRDDTTRLFFHRVEEVADDPALARDVTALLPPFVEGEPPPEVDVAVTYGRDGEIRTVHLAGLTVDSTVGRAVVERVAGAVRPQGRLVRPVHLRIRAIRRPGSPALRLLPGLFCLPHVTHEPGFPPRFLQGASVTAGRRVYPQDPRAASTIAVRVHLSRTGAIEGLEAISGNESLLERARAALAETVFDLALLNGEAIASQAEFVFRFP